MKLTRSEVPRVEGWDDLRDARNGPPRRICIIGCGYVGLANACGFVGRGHEVVGVERDPARLAALCSGRVPFYEPGLEEKLAENVAAGRLSFTGDCSEGMRERRFRLSRRQHARRRKRASQPQPLLASSLRPGPCRVQRAADCGGEEHRPCRHEPGAGRVPSTGKWR